MKYFLLFALLLPAPTDTSAKAVIAKAAAYAAAYEKNFAFVLADEHYLQSRLSGRALETLQERRSISAEAFLTYVAQSDAWIFVRDVKTVDDQPVGKGERPKNVHFLLRPSPLAK